MRRTCLGIVVLMLLLLALLQIAAAAEPDALDTLTDVNVKNMDVREVFATIFQTIDADYILGEDVLGTISISQTNKPVRTILDLVCAARNLHWWKKGDTYIVSTQPAPVAGDQLDSPLVPSESALAPPPSEMKLRQYKAKFMNPRDLAAAFNTRQKESIEKMLWDMDHTSLFLRHGLNESRKGYEGSQLRPFAFGNSRIGESSQYPLGQSISGAPLGAPLGAAPTAAAIEEQLLESEFDITAPFAMFVPDGMTPPVAYEPLNLLIFEATDEAYERFLELVRMLDQKPQQVLLEVQYLTINKSDAFSLGMDWFYNFGATSIETGGLAPGGFVNILLSKGDDFGAVISTLLTTSRARLVRSPRIIATNGMQADLNFTQDVPYVDFGGAVAVPNGGTIGGGATVLTRSIPTSLSFLPRVNSDDSISFFLNPIVSSYQDYVVPTPDGGTQSVPLVSTNDLFTFITVNDGETVVLGGFVDRNESVNVSKVPLLGDLPLLGNLFKRYERSTSDSELLIFVTPTIVRSESPTVTIGPF